MEKVERQLLIRRRYRARQSDRVAIDRRLRRLEHRLSARSRRCRAFPIAFSAAVSPFPQIGASIIGSPPAPPISNPESPVSPDSRLLGRLPATPCDSGDRLSARERALQELRRLAEDEMALGADLEEGDEEDEVGGVEESEDDTDDFWGSSYPKANTMSIFGWGPRRNYNSSAHGMFPSLPSPHGVQSDPEAPGIWSRCFSPGSRSPGAWSSPGIYGSTDSPRLQDSANDAATVAAAVAEDETKEWNIFPEGYDYEDAEQTRRLLRGIGSHADNDEDDDEREDDAENRLHLGGLIGSSARKRHHCRHRKSSPGSPVNREISSPQNRLSGTPKNNALRSRRFVTLASVLGSDISSSSSSSSSSDGSSDDADYIDEAVDDDDDDGEDDEEDEDEASVIASLREFI
ncbi:unnamed protein product [Protopolystoma xenopodis]|uniref:Uncharacterized protein n=1 Tax=Protopolystoma xenopodis TaxID=117903 RepID=A0A448XHH5_9PLAT|nr:unnamed protein product [Protopolystoma xenopodis]